MANNAISGQDYQLKWKTDFLATPPSNHGDRMAFTDAGFSINFVIRTGEEAIGLPVPRTGTELGFGPDKVQIKVAPNRVRMWSAPDGRTDDMLAHEQGHYSIVGQIMWDLWDDLLSPPQVFTTDADARTWANSMMSDAKALIDKLESNNVRDGVYDTQTEHSQNAVEQDKWNRAFALASPPTGMRFTEALKAMGISI